MRDVFPVLAIVGVVALGACQRHENAPPPPTAPSPASPSSQTPASAGNPDASTPAEPGAETSGAATTGKVSITKGEQVFNGTCAACHATGVAGAPKVGDKAAWAPHLAKGDQVLLQHARNGYKGKSGFMPPKGGNASLSDMNLRDAIAFMKSKSS